MLSPYQVIDDKKLGKPLAASTVKQFVSEYVAGSVSDAQMAAFMMAVWSNGMNEEELSALTQAMAESGGNIETGSIQQLCDKHSTGGVGDKTSFLVLAMLSAVGMPVGMLSGRGLGHTGGTLDKLESIEGFNVSMDPEAYVTWLEGGGSAIIGQTDDLVPADKRMYELRSQTATVDSIPLIAASIMSKKIASGAKNLVLDVKYGEGAFIQNKDEALELAKTMAGIGNNAGMNVSFIMSSMDDVLGMTAGNVVEILECLDIMSGKATSLNTDLVDLSVALASRLYRLANPNQDIDIVSKLRQTLVDGQAYSAFIEMVKGQSGKIGEDGRPVMCLPDTACDILAKRAGIVYSVDVKEIGLLLAQMGANRLREGDEIHHDVGLVVNVKLGDTISEGDKLATVVYNTGESGERLSRLLPDVMESLGKCWHVGDMPA